MESVNAVPVGTEQAARVTTDTAELKPAPVGGVAIPPENKEPDEPRRLISRDAVRGRVTRRYMEIVVPEWDDATVRIQSLTADERDHYEDSFYITQRNGDRKQDLKHMRARLTRMSVVDDNGATIFTDEDENWLGEQDAAALDRIFSASARFSRISKVDVDDDVKNSKRTR